jgi:hypothetical protein
MPEINQYALLDTLGQLLTQILYRVQDEDDFKYVDDLVRAKTLVNELKGQITK